MHPPLTTETDKGTLDRLVENEGHFQIIQAGVRGVASTWTLAAFAGIAILLQQLHDVEWLFPPLLLAILMCAMVNVGLTVLWIIDQIVYQRLFNTNYLIGLRLEQQFSSIPPVRAIQALTTQGKSISSWVRYFYVGPMFAFGITALGLALMSSDIVNSGSVTRSIDYPSWVIVVVGLLPLIPIVWLIYSSREVSFFRVVTSLPGDFLEILKEENCRAIVERYLEWLTTKRLSK